MRLRPRLWRGVAIVAMAWLAGAWANDGEPVFENLGQPVIDRSLNIGAVTRGPDGCDTAWGIENVRGKAQQALVGVRLDTGEVVRHDLSRYGASTSCIFGGRDGNAYLYLGSPAHFLRYRAASGEIEDLGVPAKPSSYFNGPHLAPDGIAYLGTYPTTSLVWVNTATGEQGSYGRMSDDARQSYALSTAVAADGMIYVGVGLHHLELWALNPATREKKQILPPELTAKQGNPTVFRGADGQVYGRGGGLTFRCYPDRIEEAAAPAAAPQPRPASEGWLVGSVAASGVLTLTREGQEPRRVTTAYAGKPVMIHAVAAVRDGKVYGSSLLPGNFFEVDTATGKTRDLGVITRGPFQVYDIIDRPQGLFVSSYMGCHIDLYRPELPLKAGENPRYLGMAKGQERPIQWCLGPDGRLYTGTVPSKGRLGGTILRVDPESGAIKQFEPPIANLSVSYLAALQGTSLLFGTTGIHGGSSAIPVEKEAVCFLWDCDREAVVWQGQPLPGTTAYGRAVQAANGLLYGVAHHRFYVFDPATREVVTSGDLPVKALAFPTLNDQPVGPRGLIVGVGGGQAVALDPATNQAVTLLSHESLTKVHGFVVDPGGTLYYGSGTELWRVKLPL
ncbi:MAG: PQQ-like beta-propeller repeat protein [Armatimonadetes bacterium]|nr:PQQ-like beta-propeller repeat protein [Armatimonadota bacterium]